MKTRRNARGRNVWYKRGETGDVKNLSGKEVQTPENLVEDPCPEWGGEGRLNPLAERRVADLVPEKKVLLKANGHNGRSLNKTKGVRDAGGQGKKRCGEKRRFRGGGWESQQPIQKDLIQTVIKRERGT